MEHIGYAAMTETPCVFVDVQRGGPSTGLPTLVAQGDMMQARWGSHGDYEVIALCPNSPQECFDLTIRAFNLAEQYRTPVMFMMDECVGHMTEKVVIPPAEEIEVTPRRITSRKPGDFLLYQGGEDGVPEMVEAGEGYRFHVTGLTHNEKGYPSMTVRTQDQLIRRLKSKIEDNAAKIALNEEIDVEGADVVVVAYGITSRVAMKSIEMVRERGYKINNRKLRVGMFRLITPWPFPDERIKQIAKRVRGLVVPELNLGQMCREVQRASAGLATVLPVLHAGGTVHDPKQIVEAILEAAK